MNESGLNPFRPTRWEHHQEGRPLIWFTPTADELTGVKSAFVYGGRGAGKTTLLKAICWEELSYNESLRTQRKLADFNHIGIYIRFPDHISASMSHIGWGNVFPNSQDVDLKYHRFFSLAVELTCIEKTLDACHALRLIGSIEYQPSEELRIVNDVLMEFDGLSAFSTTAPKTFLELARLCRVVVRRMNEACGRESLLPFMDRLPAREPYQILAYTAERLADAVRLVSLIERRRVGFKFCLDDCEALSAIQRKSLNTLVRLSKAPISWVVSSVGTVHDDGATFIAAQPLTDADRSVLMLDNRDSSDFKQLCQSVVSLRLYFSLPPSQRQSFGDIGKVPAFDLDQRLGLKDINDLFSQLVRRSKSPIALYVQTAAERLLTAVRAADPLSARRYSAKRNRLPYYEAYILMHWKGREDSFAASFSQIDIARMAQFGNVFADQKLNAWIRRKQLAALLHFAASLRSRKLPLSGSSIVVSLADSSIRDFLEIMGEIFESYASAHDIDKNQPESLVRFATSRTTIAAHIQTDGIYSASEKYLGGVTTRPEVDTDAVSRLITGFGNLTAILQSNTSDPRVFGAAERGVFIIDYPASEATKSDDEFRFVRAAIQQALLAGYLRTVEIPKSLRTRHKFDSAGPIAFRLHRRFAPHFRFSHRGAYEPVRIAPQDVVRLCLRPDEGSPFAWAKQMAGIMGKFNDGQTSLPFIEVENDDN